MAMKFRGRRRPLNWRFVIFALLVLLVFSTAETIYYVDTNLRPTFMTVAREYSKQLATDVINDAITQRIADEADYNKLINFKEMSDGKLAAGYFDMGEANRLQAKVTKDIQDVLKKVGEKEERLPLGLAFHNSILASLGPDIPVKVQPIGFVKSNVGWETKDAGINQTVHILYIEIDVETSVVVPFSTEAYDMKTKVPIAYLVMVGDVPQMVFNSKGESLSSNSGSSVMPSFQLPKLNEEEQTK